MSFETSEGINRSLFDLYNKEVGFWHSQDSLWRKGGGVRKHGRRVVEMAGKKVSGVGPSEDLFKNKDI